MSGTVTSHLELSPLGAGDLIDRTVRLYRRHFGVLVRAAAAPVVVSAAGWILMTLGWRGVALTESEPRLALYGLAVAGGLLLWGVGGLAQLVVMGGASRSLVMHLLRGEPVTTRLIYRGVRARFWALLGASLLISGYLLAVSAASLVVLYLTLAVAGLGALALAQTGSAWLPLVFVMGATLAGTLFAVWVFFFFAGRAAYVPQALTVEGKGVFAAVGRSVRLARGNTLRLIVMFFFTVFASYSALMLLLVPLGWAGYLLGISPLEWDASRLPAWYAISYEVVAQLSTILLAPVWMLGLSLLYVDERVRHEGYDIELLAAQRLGDIPNLPAGYQTPLQPALADPQADEPPPPAGGGPTGSILGLSGR
ncbi:MAG TPA: hypothetical protein VEY09_08855 [Pyrinomonadaceae bacterium]|nr:hypothetical protein [Pyrinomonadaceae bacterium]